MVTRTFLSKCTTIINGSEDNFGLNPVCMLNYGQTVSRALIYFDIDKIKKTSEEYGDESLTHKLILTNCGNTVTKGFKSPIPSNDFSGSKKRATSFDVILFKIPEFWDAGVGFDNSEDFWLLGEASVSQDGANWYQAYNGKDWGVKIDDSGYTVTEEGIYSNDFLSKELKKYLDGEESVIIATQHFDYGNENFNFDITKFVNEILGGATNNGLCLAFSPSLEASSTPITQYVGFFSNNTNTFFHPYVETRTTKHLQDDRSACYSGKLNKIYFYSVLGGVPTDLDEVPTCTIEGEICPVFRQSRGVYYAEYKPNKKSESVVYDLWENVVYSGEVIDDEFEYRINVLPSNKFFKFNNLSAPQRFEPSLSGINDYAKIPQGDERIITVLFKMPYSSSVQIIDNAYYRIYVKDGEREIDVVDWDFIEKGFDYNFFKIKTDELLPAEYHVDIKTEVNNEKLIFKNKLIFTVVDNVTELKK